MSYKHTSEVQYLKQLVSNCSDFSESRYHDLKVNDFYFDQFLNAKLIIISQTIDNIS